MRFHAFQSLTGFLLLFLLMQLPVLGEIFAPILALLTVILWVVGMYQAYHGHTYRMPIVGEFAAKELEIFE